MGNKEIRKTLNNSYVAIKETNVKEADYQSSVKHKDLLRSAQKSQCFQYISCNSVFHSFPNCAILSTMGMSENTLLCFGALQMFMNFDS